MFKHSTRRKNKSNFRNLIHDNTRYYELDFDFDFNIKDKIDFIKTSDFQNVKLPEKNKGLFIITDRVRNPDLILKKIEDEQGINELIIFASRINGCSFLEKTDVLITSRENKTDIRYRVHAKIIIVNDYIIFSSANLNNTNATIEQYLILNNKCLKNKLKTNIKETLKKLKK